MNKIATKKYLSYQDAKLKITKVRQSIKKISIYHDSYDGKKELKSHLTLNNQAQYNYFYNHPQVHHLQMTRGLPRFPEIYYKSDGWINWNDFLSCKEISSHLFEIPEIDFKHKIDIKFKTLDSKTIVKAGTIIENGKSNFVDVDYVQLKDDIKKLIKIVNEKSLEFITNTALESMKSAAEVTVENVFIIKSKNTWKKFYRNFSTQESFLGSLYSIDNLLGKYSLCEEKKNDNQVNVVQVNLWKGWPELLGIKRQKTFTLDANSNARENNLKKKYSNYKDASKDVKKIINDLESKGNNQNMIISTINDWKNFYKKHSGEFTAEIPYIPHLEETYKLEWFSYLHFTGKSFFDLHKDLIKKYSIYDYESFIVSKTPEKNDEINILLNKLPKKGLHRLAFMAGFVAIDEYYHILKCLSENSTKLIEWHCKICKKNFTTSIKDLVQEKIHKECDYIKGPEPIYYDEDCIKCKDGLIRNYDQESYSYCDCDYAKSLEDHPDNYQPPDP